MNTGSIIPSEIENSRLEIIPTHLSRTISRKLENMATVLFCGLIVDFDP